MTSIQKMREAVQIIDTLDAAIQSLMVDVAQSSKYENLPNIVDLRQRLDLFRKRWIAICDDVEHH